MYRFSHKPTNIQFINTALPYPTNTSHFIKLLKDFTKRLYAKSKYTFLLTHNAENYKDTKYFSDTLNIKKINVISVSQLDSLEKYKFLLGEEDSVTLLLDNTTTAERNNFFTKLPLTFVLAIKLEHITKEDE